MRKASSAPSVVYLKTCARKDRRASVEHARSETPFVVLRPDLLSSRFYLFLQTVLFTFKYFIDISDKVRLIENFSDQ